MLPNRALAARAGELAGACLAQAVLVGLGLAHLNQSVLLVGGHCVKLGVAHLTQSSRVLLASVLHLTQSSRVLLASVPVALCVVQVLGVSDWTQSLGLLLASVSAVLCIAQFGATHLLPPQGLMVVALSVQLHQRHHHHHLPLQGPAAVALSVQHLQLWTAGHLSSHCCMTSWSVQIQAPGQHMARQAALSTAGTAREPALRWCRQR